MFADTYKADGVVLKTWLGVQYPEAFTHPADEYRALTSTAALIDLCHWGVLRLTGNDGVRLLNSLTTNDAASLDTGGGCHSALTTRKGKLQAELYVLRRQEELLVLVAQGDTGVVADTIEKHIIADDVDVADVSADTAVVAVEGPKSREVLSRLFPNQPIPDAPLRFSDTDYLGTPVTIVRNSVTGESGYHLIVPAGNARRLRDHLIQSGRADDMSLIGRVAWNTRRVEAGLPWWRADVTADENFPKECRLDGVVDYTKGCFLGQETLARMHHRGHPNWLLVGLTPREDLAGLETHGDNWADPSAALPVDAPLFAPADLDQQAGRLTSPVYSPKLQKPLALGYVRPALAEPGTELILRINDHDTPLVVTPLPLK
jgi:folate-binding protein YgfZ